MDVVDVDDVGLNPLDLSDKSLRGTRRGQPVTVEKACHDAVPTHTPFIAYGDEL